MLGQDDEATLDSIFNDDEEKGEQVEESQAETQDEQKQEESSEASEETTETEEKAEEETEAETEEEVTPTSDTSNHVPMDALISERRKRQEAEKRLSEYESKKEEVPDPVTDPEGYQAYNDRKIQELGWQTRASISRDVMLESKEDFTEKEKVFISLLGDVDENGKLTVTDQSLYNKFTQSTNPARFAYDHATKHLEFQEKTSPDYEKNLREKIKAEVMAELDKDSEKVTAGKVPNLTKHTAAQSNDTQKESDYDSLEDVMEGSAL